MDKCTLCGKEADELCSDLVCRDCHVSVSWEDCINRTFDAASALKSGISMELAKKMFPDADFDKIHSGQPIHRRVKRE